MLIASAAPSALACDFDKAPSSRWTLAQENGVDWLKTPCGERFYSLGVNILDGGNGEHAKLGNAYTGYDWHRFAPTIADWGDETRRRLTTWGFNSAGGWSLPPQELRPARWRPSLARAEFWERFDDAVESLSRARTGLSVIAIAQAFGQLSSAAWELAEAVDHGHRQRATRAG